MKDAPIDTPTNLNVGFNFILEQRNAHIAAGIIFCIIYDSGGLLWEKTTLRNDERL